jgi:hypothetical protein
MSLRGGTRAWHFIPSQSSKVAGGMPAKDQMSDTVLVKIYIQPCRTGDDDSRNIFINLRRRRALVTQGAPPWVKFQQPG